MPTEIFCSFLPKYFPVSSYQASLSALFACNTNFRDHVGFFLPGSLCQDTVADNAACIMLVTADYAHEVNLK